jgi:DNA-binding protein
MTLQNLTPPTLWRLAFVSWFACCKISSVSPFEISNHLLNTVDDGSNLDSIKIKDGIEALNSDIDFVNEINRHERRLQSAVLLPFRINCGNTTTSYTDPSTSKVWAIDQYFTGSEVWNGCPEAARLGVNLASHLCQTRQRSIFEYRIPVSYSGAYKVTLHFVETLRTAAATRVFSIRAEGITILRNLDVYSITGGRMIPYVRTFNVTVNDGILTLRASATIDRAMISAIEIEDGRVRPPTRQPTRKPTIKPTSKPTSLPTRKPTLKPTAFPIRKPTSAPAVKPTVPVQPTPTLSTVRINCGGSAPYVDPLTNNTWSADINFQNGSRYNVCPAEIFNTTIDTVFCSERWFGGGTGVNGTYTIPVIPGMYTVRLLFAELFFNSPGSRVFNVYLQNRLVRSSLDIRAVTGARNTSLILPFKATVPSTDPNVRVKLQTIAQNAKISGIEIVPYDGSVTDMPTSQPTMRPTRAPTNVYETIRINCGYNLPYTDSLAREYAPDQFFEGGSTVSNVVSIANTVDDTLYQFDRVGDIFTYEIPVPIGSFAISLLFSENEYNATGQRLFDIDVEGEVLKNVDIFQLAGGAFRAARLQVFQVVEDNFLSIRFTRSAQFPNAGLPKVSAIEVELDQPHIAHSVATGPYFGTVVNPVTNRADIQLVGQTSHTHGDGQTLTNFTWKEGSTLLGTTVNTNYSFTVGLHTISLEVKDSGGSTNTEVTSVTINPFGFPAITSFIPSSGNLTGLYPVIIVGSGFNYTANQITVRFGTTVLTGSAITVINQTAIQVLAPSNVVAQATGVSVQTPLGTSIPSFFNYVGSIPIQWQEIKLLDFFQPTVGRFGPDRKLYVGTRRGRILKITMNSDFTSVVNTIVSFVNPQNEESV